MKRILLHIGTEKTGSTSIQKFIHDNRKELSERNVYVPNAGLESKHHFNLARSLGFSSSHAQGKRERRQVLKQLNDELTSCKQDNVLISSEHFDISATADSFANLASCFQGYQLSVIIVLRNQIDYAKSLYMEFIKWGGILTFEEFMRSTIRNAKYNYLARYRAWSNISDSVEVIDFDRHKSSLIQTFVKALNLIDQLDAASAESHKTNESVSADFMEFVRMMNTCIPKEGRRNNYLELLESFSKNSPEMLQKRSWGFSQPPRFAEFLDATSVQNEELARILRVSKKTFLGGSVTSRAKQASKLENPSMSRVINCLHHANGQALR